MDVNFDEELLFTGSRDGAMFLTKLGSPTSYMEKPYMKIYQTQP